uniref:Uncharacterized protein n=1 Tax=Anopheles dirus TaxID=7168 RepID=A0A182NYX4_9DIPT
CVRACVRTEKPPAVRAAGCVRKQKQIREHTHTDGAFSAGFCEKSNREAEPEPRFCIISTLVTMLCVTRVEI